MPVSPLGAFNFSIKGESTDSPGTGSYFVLAKYGLTTYTYCVLVQP